MSQISLARPHLHDGAVEEAICCLGDDDGDDPSAKAPPGISLDKNTLMPRLQGIQGNACSVQLEAWCVENQGECDL
jgi:hypothetical protein